MWPSLSATGSHIVPFIGFSPRIYLTCCVRTSDILNCIKNHVSIIWDLLWRAGIPPPHPPRRILPMMWTMLPCYRCNVLFYPFHRFTSYVSIVLMSISYWFRDYVYYCFSGFRLFWYFGTYWVMQRFWRTICGQRHSWFLVRILIGDYMMRNILFIYTSL